MSDPSFANHSNANFGPEDIPRYETCGTCRGAGYSNHPDSGEVCETCGGSGGVERTTAAAPTHDDLCRLSRIFNDTDHVLPHGARFRINEWLKVQIAAVDDIAGMAWWNALTEQERTAWAMAAGNTGRAKDAWEAFKRVTITPYLDNGVSP